MCGRLFLYLLRWQLSTPILAFVTYLLVDKYGSVTSAIIANLIGGLIFYKVDKLIFRFSSADEIIFKQQKKLKIYD